MWHLGFLPKVRLVTPAVKLARLLGGLRVCVFYIYLGKNASSYGEFRLIEIEMNQLTFDGILKQKKYRNCIAIVFFKNADLVSEKRS